MGKPAGEAERDMEDILMKSTCDHNQKSNQNLNQTKDLPG